MKNKIKELRRLKGLTQEKLASLIGVSRSTVSMWELNASEPDFRSLALLGKIFNESSDYIIGNSNTSDKKTGVRIRVLGQIPAGIPFEAIEDLGEFEDISEDLAATGEFFALKVKGDSMSPQILSGDIIIIKVQEDANNGDVCVVFENGHEATLKKIQKSLTGITLIANNPSHTDYPKFFSNKEIQELPIRILGKAIEIRRNI